MNGIISIEPVRPQLGSSVWSGVLKGSKELKLVANEVKTYERATGRTAIHPLTFHGRESNQEEVPQPSEKGTAPVLVLVSDSQTWR